MMRRRDDEAGGGCPVEEISGARRNERHRIIAAASQDFLDKPDQISSVNRDLFRCLVVNTIPVLQGKAPDDKDVDTWFANSPVERRLLIVRGQQQALRSALAHVVFIDLAGSILSLLERGESLVPPAKEMPRDDAYVGDVIRVPYSGGYHQFMLAGARWIKQPSFDFVESVRNLGHPYHQLLVAMCNIQSAVRSGRMEQQGKRSHAAHQGVIRDPEDLRSYQPLFLGNLQDMMIPLVAAQKAYIARVGEEDRGSPRPEEIVRLVLANLDTLSLPAHMKREAALKIIPHPLIRYADQPMEEKPFASMPPLFAVVGDLEESRLELAPEFAYLQSAKRSFCAGVITHRSSDPRGRETAERLLSAAGAPSGRSPRSPDYGKIDPITILAIIGARTARDTIFRESPF
jgi:hypothetical protein